MTTKEKRMNAWGDINSTARNPSIWQLTCESDESISDPLIAEEVPEEFLDSDWKKMLVISQKAKNKCIFAKGYLIAQFPSGLFIDKIMEELAESLTFGDKYSPLSIQLWEEKEKLNCLIDEDLEQFSCVKSYIDVVNSIEFAQLENVNVVELIRTWNDLKIKFCDIVESDLKRRVG